MSNIDSFRYRRTDANLYRMLRVDKTLFDRVKENEAVSIGAARNLTKYQRVVEVH